jgi:hypothetical protein
MLPLNINAVQANDDTHKTPNWIIPVLYIDGDIELEEIYKLSVEDI